MSVTQQVIEDGEQWGYDSGVAAERERIIAWLRNGECPWALSDVADAIERGEHVSGASTK
jgi:hypothetical protein